MKNDDITLRHCRTLQNYFNHEDLGKILDGQGYTRISPAGLFKSGTPLAIREHVITNLETIYEYISVDPATTVERFKRIMAIAVAYDCRYVKYLSSTDFFQELHYHAGSRGSLFKRVNRFVVVNVSNFFKLKKIKPLVYTKGNDTGNLVIMPKVENFEYASNSEISKLMTIYENSKETLERLNYDVPELPIKWHIPQTLEMSGMPQAHQLNQRSDNILQSMLLQQLKITDLQGLYKLHLEAITQHFINIIRVQVTEFYIIDQITKFNHESNALTIVSSHHEFDDVNLAISQLQVLIALVNKYQTDTKNLYLTPELIDMLAPLCTVNLRKMINADIEANTQKFRRGTRAHVQTLQQIVSNYKSKKRKYYFMRFDTIQKVFDDFRLYDRHFAKYTVAYINQQSENWRKAFGNIEATIKIETKQNEKLVYNKGITK